MVGQLVLVQPIGVRIPVPEPMKRRPIVGLFFIAIDRYCQYIYNNDA
jgi:hypothetical protein